MRRDVSIGIVMGLLVAVIMLATASYVSAAGQESVNIINKQNVKIPAGEQYEVTQVVTAGQYLVCTKLRMGADRKLYEVAFINTTKGGKNVTGKTWQELKHSTTCYTFNQNKDGEVGALVRSPEGRNLYLETMQVKVRRIGDTGVTAKFKELWRANTYGGN